MKYFGTKNNKDYGFYEEKFDNSIEITDEYWAELLKEQSNGKMIILYEGNVIAVNEMEYEKKNGIWEKLTKENAEIKQLNIQNAIRKNEILAEMEEIDKKRIRALAEPVLKDDEITWLEYYNNQIQTLRNELNQLNT